MQATQLVTRKKKVREILLNFCSKLGHMDKSEIIQYYCNNLLMYILKLYSTFLKFTEL